MALGGPAAAIWARSENWESKPEVPRATMMENNGPELWCEQSV